VLGEIRDRIDELGLVALDGRADFIEQVALDALQWSEAEEARRGNRPSERYVERR